MFKKLLLAGAAAFLVSSTGSAFADTIFSLTDNACSGCTVSPAGTVDLSQNGANSVLVTVQLNSDYSFRLSPDKNHWSFVFDTTVPVTASNITSGPTSQTFVFDGLGSYTAAGISGNNPFDYAFSCTTCSKGTPGPTLGTETLMFDLTGAGLTTSSFLDNNGDYFGVDVVSLAGNTGNFGAPGPGTPTTSVTPEPSSIVLLATGVLGIAGTLRRRLLA